MNVKFETEIIVKLTSNEVFIINEMLSRYECYLKPHSIDPKFRVSKIMRFNTSVNAEKHYMDFFYLKVFFSEAIPVLLEMDNEGKSTEKKTCDNFVKFLEFDVIPVLRGKSVDNMFEKEK